MKGRRDRERELKKGRKEGKKEGKKDDDDDGLAGLMMKMFKFSSNLFRSLQGAGNFSLFSV